MLAWRPWFFFVKTVANFISEFPHQWPKGFVYSGITDRSTGLHYFMTTPASWVVPLNTPLNIGCNLAPLGLGKSKLSRDNPTSWIYIWLVTPLTMTTLRFFKYCNVRISPSTHGAKHAMDCHYFQPKLQHQPRWRGGGFPWATSFLKSWLVNQPLPWSP